MKRIRLTVFLLLACLLFTGCSFLKGLADSVTEKTFEVLDYGLEITTDMTFKIEDSEDNPWDLQITDGYVYVSIFAYRYSEIEGWTAEELFDFHNNDIFSKRDDVVVLAEKTTQELTDKTVTNALFSAKNDGIESYYDAYLIDFKDDGMMAYVMTTSTPEYAKDHLQNLKDIVYTLRVIEETEN